MSYTPKNYLINDLRIDCFRGGRSNGVKITHIPTGIVVRMDSEEAGTASLYKMRNMLLEQLDTKLL